MENFIALNILHRRKVVLPLNVKYSPGYREYVLKYKTKPPLFSTFEFGQTGSGFSNKSGLNLSINSKLWKNLLQINGRNSFLETYMKNVAVDVFEINLYNAFKILRHYLLVEVLNLYPNINYMDAYNLFTVGIMASVLKKHKFKTNEEIEKTNPSSVFDKEFIKKIVEEEFF